MSKFALLAAVLLPVAAAAQPVTVVRPLAGYACMALNLSEAQLLDQKAPRVGIMTEPRWDAPVGTLAAATVIVRFPLHRVGEFVEVLQLTGRAGWVSERMLRPSPPGCTPALLSNGRIGFG